MDMETTRRKKDSMTYDILNSLTLQERAIYEEEFNQVINKHMSFLHFTIRKYDFVTDNDRMDYLQEILIQAWGAFVKKKKSDKIRQGALTAWLGKVAEYAILHYRRDFHRKNERFVYTEKTAIFDDALDEYNEPHLESLKKMISTLSEEDRRVIDLYLAGENFKEQSLAIGKGEAYLSLVLSKVVKRMRSQVHCFFEDIRVPDYLMNSSTRRMSQRNAAGKSKPIIQMEISGAAVKMFPSIMEAQRAGFNSGLICQVIKGEREQHKGFRWAYAKED